MSATGTRARGMGSGLASCLCDVTKNAVNSQIHVVLLVIVPVQFLGLTSWEDGVR
jgi:hypothetical protein